MIAEFEKLLFLIFLQRVNCFWSTELKFKLNTFVCYKRLSTPSCLAKPSHQPITAVPLDKVFIPQQTIISQLNRTELTVSLFGAPVSSKPKMLGLEFLHLLIGSDVYRFYTIGSHAIIVALCNFRTR